MSYSRWSNSIWYTYWSASSGETKDEQIFCICDLSRPFNFTYKELKENIHRCLGVVIEESKCEKNVSVLGESVTYKGLVYTEKEIDELQGYMEDFIEDMDNEFKE